MHNNGIHHITTFPYHPSSNGLAERAVLMFKSGMKKLTEGTLETRVTRFLFHYRTMPHATTEQSPADRRTAQDTPGSSQAYHRQESQSTPGTAEESPQCLLATKGAPAWGTGLCQELWSRAAIAPWTHPRVQGPGVVHC